MSTTQASVPTVSNAITIAEDVLTRTAEVIREVSATTEGRVSADLEVFTVEESVVLRKALDSGSSDIEVVVIELAQAKDAVGGFLTESSTRTYKNADGKGYVNTAITVAVAPEFSGVEVNMGGVERSIEVLCEGYVRSLEVLYSPISTARI